jgi:hypothetical protein
LITRISVVLAGTNRSSDRVRPARPTAQEVYPRGMAGKPAEGREHQPDREREPGGEHELEHIGPVAIARHVKDDGRALILYSEQPRAEQERSQA